MATKQASKNKTSRSDLGPTIQWLALTGVFVLIVLAVFVFGIGGAGSGGGGHSGGGLGN